MQSTGALDTAVRHRRLPLLALALGVLLGTAAAGLTVSAGDRSVAPNGTVVVQIAVAGAEEIAGIDLVLAYDPAVLRFQSVEPGDLVDRARVTANETSPGRLTVAVASPSLTGNGPIAALTFSAVGSAGTRSPLALEGVSAFTADGDSVPVQAVNGTVSVGGGVATPFSPFAVLGALGVAGAAASIGLGRRR